MTKAFVSRIPCDSSGANYSRFKTWNPKLVFFSLPPPPTSSPGALCHRDLRHGHQHACSHCALHQCLQVRRQESPLCKNTLTFPTLGNWLCIHTGKTQTNKTTTRSSYVQSRFHLSECNFHSCGCGCVSGGNEHRKWGFWKTADFVNSLSAFSDDGSDFQLPPDLHSLFLCLFNE